MSNMSDESNMSSQYTVEVLSVDRSDCLGEGAYGVDAEVKVTRATDARVDGASVIGELTAVPAADGRPELEGFGGEPSAWLAGDLYYDLHELAYDREIEWVVDEQGADGEDEVRDCADYEAREVRADLLTRILWHVTEAAEQAGLPVSRDDARELLREEVARG